MTTPRIGGRPTDAVIQQQLTDQTKVQYADLRRTRGGLQQDVGYDRLIWMGLPYWAPTGAGVAIGTYNVPLGEGQTGPPQVRTLQMLPIEGVLQWIPPRVQSQMRVLPLVTDPAATEDELGQGQIWTAAQIRQRVSIGNAGLRIAWHGEYATHGGPYGLYEASLNRDLAVTFVEFQSEPLSNNPANGTVVLAFNACVSEFVRTGDVNGFVADVVLSPESDIYRPNYTPSTTVNPRAADAGTVSLLSNIARQASRGDDFPSDEF